MGDCAGAADWSGMLRTSVRCHPEAIESVSVNPNAFPSDPMFPIRSEPIRFAVGAPDGLTSNSWRLWTSKAGDIYLKCRDSMRETKVSLHASGRWRMGITDEAVRARPGLVPAGRDRAWEVWDEPPPVAPGVIAAIQLIFPTSELAVRPDQRATTTWRDTIFIEAAPAGVGRVVAVTVFITTGDIAVVAEPGLSARLASLPLPGGRWVQLVVHHEPELDLHPLVDQTRRAALLQAGPGPTDLPPTAYAYLWGQRESGARFLVGARVFPDHGGQRSLTGGSAPPLEASVPQ